MLPQKSEIKPMKLCFISGIHFPKKFASNALETYHGLGKQDQPFAESTKASEAAHPKGEHEKVLLSAVTR